MPDHILKFIAEVPDHIQAMALIVLGAAVSLIHNQHDTGQALIAAGLTAWRGRVSPDA